MHVMDGGLLEIEHFGKPGSLRINDKRAKTKLAERIRESIEYLIVEIDELDAEVEAVDQVVDEWLQKMREKIMWYKKKNDSKKTIKKDEVA